MKIVSVVFQSKQEPKEFSGREYSYYAAIPVNYGDIVLAPTKNGESKAKVVKTNIAESELNFDPGLLKVIETLAPDEQVNNGEASTPTVPTF